jgi:uncharacterized protein YjbJ (UPF0337 family)
MTNTTIDKAKGRLRDAAGALTGDRRRKREGQLDQTKRSAGSLGDRVANALHASKTDSGRG